MARTSILLAALLLSVLPATIAGAAPLPARNPAFAAETLPPRKPAPADRLPSVKPLRVLQESAAGTGSGPGPSAPAAVSRARPAGGPAAPDPAEQAACEAELRDLGAEFERREPIDGEGVCGVAAPYNLRRVGDVVIQPDTELTCATALATARWIRGVVQPAAEAIGPGVSLGEVTHASTYVCRNRNNADTAKVSEHARGRAIDVAGFDLDGREPVPVVPRQGDGSAEEAFQRAVRAGACLHFTTVLGPGTDAYHDDHLHLDTIRRSSGFRLCE